MPIRTMFSHAYRLVTVVAEGDLFPAQITELLELIDRHDARSYAKLIDIRRLRSCVRPDGESTLATLAAERASAGAIGAIALVTGDHGSCQVAAQRFAAAGTEERPIRVFRDEPSGWAWLQHIRR